MRAAVDKSPLALTQSMAAALAMIAATPLLDASAIARAVGPSSEALELLCKRGLTKAKAGARRDGTKATLYQATRKGFDALDRHAKARKPTVTVGPAMVDGSAYTCPELGQTCYRPGAYDALAFPSRFGNELHFRDGAVERIDAPAKTEQTC